MQYKIELERILTREVRKRQGWTSEVTITQDGEFAVYNVADRFTVRRLSGLGKDFLLNGHLGSGSPEECLVGGLVHLADHQTESHRLQIPYRCRDCGCKVGRRSRQRDWIERYVLPLILLRPVRCATCFRRDYWPISTRVWESAPKEITGTGDLSHRAA